MKRKNNSLFNISLLNKEINEKGKHVLVFDHEFPLIVREYNFNFEFPVKPNHHDYLEIIYILQNKTIIQCSEKKFFVKKGDLLIICKNELHTCFQFENYSVSLVSLKFFSELIYDFTGYDIDFEYLRPFYCKSPEFKNLVPNKSNNQLKILDKIYFIKELIKQKRKYYKIKAKIALTEILLDIVESYNKLPLELFDSHSKHLRDLNRLKNAFDLLNKEYSEKITLKKVAKTVYMNESYFSTFFKRVTGFTYSNYLQRVRIEKAKELLSNKDFSITYIAFLTGFNTLNYFNKTFKKFTNLTPSEYIRKIKMHNNA